ncbi:MAG: hypothetical protein ACLQDY_23860 [Streptosporangiaceae bacterium]
MTGNSSGITERLIGPRPPEGFIRGSHARLDALFRQKFEQREGLWDEQRRISEAPATLLRNLAKDDPATERTVKETRARSKKRAQRVLSAPKRTKIKSRAHLSSIDVTFVPPYTWPWQWTATTGSATADADADQNNGTMSFDAWTGENGKTAACAVAVGSYFQPMADAAFMYVSAVPAFNYIWDSDNVFDNSHTHAFLGLYVGQYTLEGEFTQAVVDQQIGLWDSGGGSDQGTNSGFPLLAGTPVDSDHFYEIWVWAGGDAEADGWSVFWGSAALSAMNLTVPSISVAAG